MNKKLLTVLFSILLFTLPVTAIVEGQALDIVLKDAKIELREDYTRRQNMQNRMHANFLHQHSRMLGVIKKCNELSMQLYLQKKEYTLDLSYALQQVTTEYESFNRNRTPYLRVSSDLDLEIDRYARLIESLRRLPPALDYSNMDFLADSLRFHNDSLENHLRHSGSSLEDDVEAIVNTLADSTATPFVLSEEGQADRDSCLFYASETLKLYVQNKEDIMSDSAHYQEAFLRLKESYDYAVDRYNILQKEIFLDGQIPIWEIAARPEFYKMVAKSAAKAKYGTKDDFKEIKDAEVLSEKQENRIRIMTLLYQLGYLVLFWLLANLILWALHKWVKPLQKYKAHPQRRNLYTLIAAIILFFIMSLVNGSSSAAFVATSLQIMSTYFWVLIFIMIAVLVRINPDKINVGIKPLLPTISLAFVTFAFRVSFMPNILMNIIFPVALVLGFLWQLISCFRSAHKSEKLDKYLSWISLIVTGVAASSALFGYIFISIMIVAWWYFQIMAILAIEALNHLLGLYKRKRMVVRVARYENKISYVSGQDKKALMFGATWFYDLVKDVVIPVVALMSFPLCIRYSLDIFDFHDLFQKFFYTPFFRVVSLEGEESFRFSVNSIVALVGIFFVFKYLCKAVKSLWQQYKFSTFMRKFNTTTVQPNEVNLSLGKSVINVIVWMIYIVVVVNVLKIPTGSLGLVAGGLSAGIGLAMKDILNNFIYGIQLMSGRLRVGDWIECDGIRGKVTDINYQSTMVETVEDTQVAFLNATLFGKSFHNLTRNNAYEFTKVTVGVAYGLDVEKVRAVLEQALEVLKTTDKYGRDVVEPKFGIAIRFDSFGDSAVGIAVKQFVLVQERALFIDMEKEIIYKALNENGIAIPFPQCDVHLIKNE